MTSTVSISLHIGNAIPLGNQHETESIIALWREIGGFFNKRPFTAQNGLSGDARSYLISLDASSLVQLMENAAEHSRSFTSYQKSYIQDANQPIDAGLRITIECPDHELRDTESYQVATLFIQQLVLAANIITPGSIQILDARFMGEDAHRFEAQNFDSRVLYGARKTAVYNEWPLLRTPRLETVWAWLEGCEVSQVHTAIEDINKVLFTLLKVAEQRLEYSARTVLLIMYQLEVLLECRQTRTLSCLRKRLRQILGTIPEAADCLTELYEVRSNLFLANHPVHRPPLICHTTAEALRGQVGQHNTAVESGTALVIALLQDLIAHGSRGYKFTETFTRR